MTPAISFYAVSSVATREQGIVPAWGVIGQDGVFHYDPVAHFLNPRASCKPQVIRDAKGAQVMVCGEPSPLTPEPLV